MFTMPPVPPMAMYGAPMQMACGFQPQMMAPMRHPVPLHAPMYYPAQGSWGHLENGWLMNPMRQQQQQQHR